MARPTKLTPEVTNAITNAITLGATLKNASEAADVDYSTFKRWMSLGEQQERGQFRAFCAAVKKAEAQSVMVCLRQIQKAALDGAWQASAWILERRFPDEWGRRDRLSLEHSGSVDVNMLADVRQALVQAFPGDPDALERFADAMSEIHALATPAPKRPRTMSAAHTNRERS